MTTRSTSSSSATPPANAEPTFSAFPAYSYSEIDDCYEANLAGGLRMFDWQVAVVEPWLGRDALGRWSAGTCGLTVARQNGKSLGTVEARANYGMLVLGERVVYTAHLQKTATETFEDMAAFFDRKATRRHIKAIREALGREQIELKNGGRIKFLARTRSGGRGQHGDLLVFDEAQELDENQQASFLPAISASINPQAIYTGTPPDENAAGTVLARIRGDALRGKSRNTAWAEWGVPKLPDDPGDPALWERVNPSFGITIQERTIANEFEQMGVERFARERLGWWSEQRAEAVIGEDEWAECLTASPAADGLTVYAVKFAPDGSRGALAACVRPADGSPYIEVIESMAMSCGVGWFADWLAPRWREAAQIVVDSAANSGTLVQMLRDRGVPQKVIVAPKSAEVATACAMLSNAVTERSVTHMGQPALDRSATGAQKRPIGSGGGWGFAAIGDSDPSLVEACALALWGAMTTKRNPSRKLRIG